MTALCALVFRGDGGGCILEHGHNPAIAHRRADGFMWFDVDEKKVSVDIAPDARHVTPEEHLRQMGYGLVEIVQAWLAWHREQMNPALEVLARVESEIEVKVSGYNGSGVEVTVITQCAVDKGVRTSRVEAMQDVTVIAPGTDR